MECSGKYNLQVKAIISTKILFMVVIEFRSKLLIILNIQSSFHIKAFTRDRKPEASIKHQLLPHHQVNTDSSLVLTDSWRRGGEKEGTLVEINRTWNKHFLRECPKGILVSSTHFWRAEIVRL